MDAGPECPVAAWAPVGPPSTADRGQVGRGPPGRAGSATADLPSIAFVDGVQRIDAWADLEAGDGTLDEALFASYLAGAVTVEAVAPPPASSRAPPVSRAVFGAGPGERSPAMAASRPEGAPRTPSRRRATRSRSAVASMPGRWRPRRTDGLLVLDGPLHDRGGGARRVGAGQEPPGGLPRPPLPPAGAQRAGGGPADAGLLSGQRLGPLVVVRAGGAGASRAGPGSFAARRRPRSNSARAVELADLSARVLPRFASSPVKDPRAPQNLVPIGSLERWLRHRLGDREVLERRLRRALAAGG